MGPQARGRGARRPGTGAALDLLPVMNLVTILIPLLLMGGTLVNLVQVESRLPASTDDPVPGPAPALRLAVAITGAGFVVSGADAVLPDRIVPNEGLVLPCAGGACASAESYDYAALTDVMAEVKDAFPDEDAVVLVPGAKVPYAALIGAMDATREHGDRVLFPQVAVAGGR